MTVLSLFDGISCGNYVLKKLGFNIDRYYSSEIDRYAIEVSKKNFPDQIRLGDVNNWKNWDIDYSSIDLILAGSPCQSFSVAGKQDGFNGKSGIIEQFFQILEFVKSLNPNVKFLLENVSMKEEWKNIISDRLGVKPVLLNSKDFSAQNRKRLYWFNWDIEENKNISKSCVEDILENGITYKDKAYAITCSYPRLTFIDSLEKHRKTFVAVPIKLGYINSDSQGSRFYSVKSKSVCLSSNGGGWGAKTGLYKIDLPDGDYFFRKLTPIECERLQGLPDNYTSGCSDTQRYKMIGNGWQINTLEHIFKYLK